METLFFLKKLLTAIIMPLNIIWLMLIIATFLLWSKRYLNVAKWLVSLSVIYLYLISFSPVSHLLLSPIEKAYPQYEASSQISKSISYVWVLGHYSKADPSIPLSSQLSDDTLVRLVEGIRLYRKHMGSQLVFSGGISEENGSHPQRVKQMAIDLGVPVNDIVLAEGPKDTHEESIMAKQLVKAKMMILVTSASHMKRAVFLFEQQGLRLTPAPTGFQAKSFTGIDFFGFFPSPHAIVQFESAIYEYLGLLWTKILSWAK